MIYLIIQVFCKGLAKQLKIRRADFGKCMYDSKSNRGESGSMADVEIYLQGYIKAAVFVLPNAISHKMSKAVGHTHCFMLCYLAFL